MIRNTVWDFVAVDFGVGRDKFDMWNTIEVLHDRCAFLAEANALVYVDTNFVMVSRPYMGVNEVV